MFSKQILCICLFLIILSADAFEYGILTGQIQLLDSGEGNFAKVVCGVKTVNINNYHIENGMAGMADNGVDFVLCLAGVGAYFTKDHQCMTQIQTINPASGIVSVSVSKASGSKGCTSGGMFAAKYQCDDREITIHERHGLLYRGIRCNLIEYNNRKDSLYAGEMILGKESFYIETSGKYTNGNYGYYNKNY